ncbi:olfactory receptor 11A1-like [Pelodiscus sinensis]|uniref:olfactory receptor 11A1-like n=1 Tax=Pelodiscus sinensis TaxID=13735 RepID=UPI003F6D654F
MTGRILAVKCLEQQRLGNIPKSPTRMFFLLSENSWLAIEILKANLYWFCILPMKETGSGNITSISQILLLGFGDLKELGILLFTGFLAIYIISMATNLLLVLLVLLDPHLHTPMYFFLSSLSCLEMISTSNITPMMLSGLKTGTVTISLGGCIMQLYLFGTLATVECFLLAAMSYDRYLAVCHPLRYPSLMSGRFCGQLVFGAWVGGFLFMGIVSLLLSALSFCGPHEIDHYFCDFQPLLALSCADTSMIQTATFFLSFIPASPFLLTVASYVCIAWALLRVSFASGRRKAFSTCSSHLTVVTLFYGTLVAMYMSPRANTGLNLRKTLSLLYTVFTPLLSPLVYSLRNREGEMEFFVQVKRLEAEGETRWLEGGLEKARKLGTPTTLNNHSVPNNAPPPKKFPVYKVGDNAETF